MKKNLVKVRDVLPATSALPVQPVPLENEPPHRKLARLTREHQSVTEQLQTLKKSWAERNIKAQACRQAVSTPEVTHFETTKRELALQLLDLQTQIGALNKELRANKAARQAGRQPPARANGSALKKTCPLKSHPQWDAYFRLAAENELEPRLLAQIERSAKSLLQHALETGVESEGGTV
jgi:hypothetical protein